MSVFLVLFHGRLFPDEPMDGWGFDGPVLGPFKYVHTTYKDHIRMADENEEVFELRFVEDMVVYDEKFYGDWSVVGPDLAAFHVSLASRAEKPVSQKFMVPARFASLESSTSSDISLQAGLLSLNSCILGDLPGLKVERFADVTRMSIPFEDVFRHVVHVRKSVSGLEDERWEALLYRTHRFVQRMFMTDFKDRDALEMAVMRSRVWFHNDTDGKTGKKFIRFHNSQDADALRLHRLRH